MCMRRHRCRAGKGLPRGRGGFTAEFRESVVACACTCGVVCALVGTWMLGSVDGWGRGMAAQAGVRLRGAPSNTEHRGGEIRERRVPRYGCEEDVYSLYGTSCAGPWAVQKGIRCSHLRECALHHHENKLLWAVEG